MNLQAAQGESEPPKSEEPPAEEEKKDLEPKSRAPGGVWVSASDFPHSFQSFIVYHNVTKMSHSLTHSDKWVDAAQPFIVNEKDVIIRLELDEEALKTQIGEYNASLSGKTGDSFTLPGYVEPTTPNLDQVLIAFSPHPTSKPHDIIPRYLMHLN